MPPGAGLCSCGQLEMTTINPSRSADDVVARLEMPSAIARPVLAEPERSIEKWSGRDVREPMTSSPKGIDEIVPTTEAAGRAVTHQLYRAGLAPAGSFLPLTSPVWPDRAGRGPPGPA